MTTVDALRMKLLGYRLAGKSPEAPHHEFLTAIAEAKLQFQAIDRALDELDFSLLPKYTAPTSAAPAQETERLGQD